MAVPDDAVSTLAGVSTVYVIEDGKARQQIVTLGAHEGKHWEIVEGLKGDEMLAASQLNQLATGMAVDNGRRGGRQGAERPAAAGAAAGGQGGRQ